MLRRSASRNAPFTLLAGQTATLTANQTGYLTQIKSITVDSDPAPIPTPPTIGLILLGVMAFSAVSKKRNKGDGT